MNRQELVKSAYTKDLKPPKRQLHTSVPEGLSPLLKLANELNNELSPTVVVTVVEDFPSHPDVPRRRTSHKLR
jgi:hypothetical protein